MITTIISIGNSRGIRIPKPLLKESGIEEAVELRVKKGEIKIIPVKRKGSQSVDPVTLASEAALAKDWLRPEEDEAWKNLQKEIL
jgi:antitoxin component of MazEF toxin-antitoxin module